jgi:hypothetical protein
MYNLTTITDNANNIYEIVKYTNDLSGGLYFSLIILVLFVVYLVVFKKQEFKTVLIAGSFFMTVISILMFTAGLVGDKFLIIPIIVFLASIIIYMINMGD